MGYAAIGDLLRVKQCLNDVEAIAREHSGWQPIVHYGRGAYQTLRGDHVHALAEYDRSLALVAPGHHLVWVWSTAAMLWSLVHQQRFDDALVRGHAALIECERNDLMPSAYAVLVPLALAEGSLGRFEHALEHIQAALEQLRSDGGSGVQLGVAYEVRARIAIQQADVASFVQYADACEAVFRIGAHSALLARHEKLMRAARKAGLIEAVLSDVVDETQQSSAEDVRSTVSTVLSTAQGPEQRAERALMLLGRFSRCDTGYLYMLQRQGPVLVAQLGAAPPRLDMDEFVTRFLVDALDQRDVTQTEASEALEPKPLWTATESSRYSPMLLSHTGDRGQSVTGVAVMYVQASASFRVPARLLQALSRALYEAGDAITQLGHELDDELPPET
jgi:tetratricopeptide (TPR) repeat protein